MSITPYSSVKDTPFYLRIAKNPVVRASITTAVLVKISTLARSTPFVGFALISCFIYILYRKSRSVQIPKVEMTIRAPAVQNVIVLPTSATILSGQLTLGPKPGTGKRNFEALLDLTTESNQQDISIPFLRVPISNFTPPTVEQIKEAVAFIKAQMDARKHIYVFCQSECKISATITTAYLMTHGVSKTYNHLSMAEAIRWVQDRKKIEIYTQSLEQYVQPDPTLSAHAV